MQKKKPEFTVELARPGDFGRETSATLELPASWAEYHDALDKARITDDRTIYSVTMLGCRRDWLAPHIPEQLPGGRPLLELNLLATRMQEYIPENLDIMEAFVKIESQRTKSEPIPIPRLVNLTFATEGCHVVGDILSDTNLGKFLYENDFLSDVDYNAVLSRIESGQSASELLTLLGREHREANGGMLTASGLYVELAGEIEEVYKPGEMAYFQRTGAPVVLEFENNGRVSTLDLPPLMAKKLDSTLRAIGYNDPATARFTCKDCLIPAAREWITTAQDAQLSEQFARQLDYMERHSGVTEYKALLEAAKCSDLLAAMGLTEGIEEYQLDPEYKDMEGYAREALSNPPYSELVVDLEKHLNLYTFGQELMKQNNAMQTEYGVLSRKDGGPIFGQADTPEEGISVNIHEESFEAVELFGKPALFTNGRIDRAELPEGFYAYDLQHGDSGDPLIVEPKVMVNHAGTVITAEPLEMPSGNDPYIPLGDGGLNFVGEELTLDEFITGQGGMEMRM